MYILLYVYNLMEIRKEGLLLYHLYEVNMYSFHSPIYTLVIGHHELLFVTAMVSATA